jgi:hypothetical protein
MPDEPTVTVRMPLSHWRQIVSDYEDFCGRSRTGIEVLGKVETLDGEDFMGGYEDNDEGTGG